VQSSAVTTTAGKNVTTRQQLEPRNFSLCIKNWNREIFSAQ